jgi:hypothetical protein
MDLGQLLLDDALFTFEYYKKLAEGAMAQVPDDRFDWRPDEEANSIAIIVGHLAGNMRSRWTDFLTSDGEKPWRERDSEFEPPAKGREALMVRWEEGWQATFAALRPLHGEDVLRTVRIRGKEHTVMQAILRQTGHYAYHVGQIVQLARTLVRSEDWKTLSIARGESSIYEPAGRV